MRNYILINLALTCLLISGCASAGLNSTCAHISGSEMTVPYIGGKGNADVYACHMSCIGENCPALDYALLQKLTSDYLAQTSGKIVTSGPGTINFTPSK